MARFTRTSPAPKIKGDYYYYRPFVRKDFEQCCAYCYLHERHASGHENFQLDHFRPKDKFPKLQRTYENLYWSCAVCNGIFGKYNKWPSDEELVKGICFVDLCRDDFEQHYSIQVDGTLVPLTDSAAYTIEAINLNREHLKLYRAGLLKESKPLDTELT